jgi:aromatic ring-opening dioxygenase LigB subunit
MNSGRLVFVALMPHAPILIPAIGGGRSVECAKTSGAMRQVARRLIERKPASVVVISPHSPRQQVAFGLSSGSKLAGSFAAFGAPGVAVRVPGDSDLAARVKVSAHAHGVQTWEIPATTELDHGASVPLWFLAEAGWAGPTLVASLNYAGEGIRAFARSLADAIAQHPGTVAIIASGDMSHRLKPGAPAGYHPRAREFDTAFIGLLERAEPVDPAAIDPALRDLAAEDVVESTVIAQTAAGGDDRGREVLSYEGPFGVGYGVAILYDG